MKLVACIVVALSVVACSAPDQPQEPPTVAAAEPEAAAYRIAVVAWNAGEPETRALERLTRRYRPASEGGLLLAVTGPREASPASVGAAVEGAVADERVKAIVFSPGPVGAAEAIAKAKALRPELLCYVVSPRDQALAIQASGADLVIGLEPQTEVEGAYALTAGLVEFAKIAVDGSAARDSLDALAAEIREHAPGASVRIRHYVDPDTSVRARNHVVATIRSAEPGS